MLVDVAMDDVVAEEAVTSGFAAVSEHPATSGSSREAGRSAVGWRCSSRSNRCRATQGHPERWVSAPAPDRILHGRELLRHHQGPERRRNLGGRRAVRREGRSPQPRSPFWHRHGVIDVAPREISGWQPRPARISPTPLNIAARSPRCWPLVAAALSPRVQPAGRGTCCR